MQNIIMKRDGTKLLVEIDLTKDFGVSASGKTLVVASTRGNPAIPGSRDTHIGINVFRRIKKNPKRA